MATVKIENRIVEINDVAGYAFQVPAQSAAIPEPDELAVIQVNLRNAPPVLVKGPDAVTLKVLLSSVGVTDLGSNPQVPPG